MSVFRGKCNHEECGWRTQWVTRDQAENAIDGHAALNNGHLADLEEYNKPIKGIHRKSQDGSLDRIEDLDE